MKRGLFFTMVLFGFVFCAKAQHTQSDVKYIQCIIKNDTIYFIAGQTQIKQFFLPYSAVITPQIEVTTQDGTRTLPSKKISKPQSHMEVKVGDNALVEFVKLPKLDLYILIGQSNMAGRGLLTAQYTDVIPNTCLLNYNGNMVTAVNPLNIYSNIRKEAKMQGVGPGYGFAKTITAEIPNQIGLVVNARGGSSINSWLKGAPDGYFYKTMERVNEAKRWGDFKAILWLQGESDRKYSSTYRQKLTAMAADFREALGCGDIPFVVGEIAHWAYLESGSFNAMLQSIASSIPNSDWVSAEGLTPLINENDPHFNAESMVIMGERFALKVVQMIKKR